MNGLKKIYNRMGDDNALFILGMFGNALLVYTILGLLYHFLANEFVVIFLVGGLLNAFVACFLLLKKYDCFIHDVEQK